MRMGYEDRKRGTVDFVVQTEDTFHSSHHDHPDTQLIPQYHIVDTRQPDNTIDTSVPDFCGEGGDQEVGIKKLCGTEHFSFLNHETPWNYLDTKDTLPRKVYYYD